MGELERFKVAGNVKLGEGLGEDEVGVGLETIVAAKGVVEPCVVLEEAAKDLTFKIEEGFVDIAGGKKHDDGVVEAEVGCLEELQGVSSFEENGENLVKVGAGALELMLGSFNDLLGLYCCCGNPGGNCG